MAELNLGTTDAEKKEINVKPNEDNLSQDTVYSAEELNDPAKINVNITDKKSPLVILFGPPACGKTMTLVRLTRYLNKLGDYTVEPDKSFRPGYDKNYSNLCANFDSIVGSDDAAKSTDKVNFMLIKVISKGKTICQLLEAPGEYYFNPNQPFAAFPNFLNTVINGSNRKIWAIIVEPNYANHSDRINYVNKIDSLNKRIRNKDRVAVIFNKIDQSNFVISPGHIHTNSAIENVSNLYPGLFEKFKNNHPITRFWRQYNCRFIPFQTGDYSKTATNTLTFQEGPDEYPRNLWHEILRMIRG